MGTGWFFNRDKSSFDNSWRGDESLEASDSLPDPDFLAQEIIEDPEAAFEQFRKVVSDVGKKRDANLVLLDLFTRLSADFFEQAKVRDPAERYIADSLSIL